MISMAIPKTGLVTGPRMLPVVHYGTTAYFADLRLGQFRAVENPHDFVDFDTELGRRMCRQTGTIWCPECRMGVIVSKAVQQDRFRCMRCLNTLPSEG